MKAQMKKRFDVESVLLQALQAKEVTGIALARDATYRPDEIVTVVQAVTVRPVGELPVRMAFDVKVVLHTTGENTDVVLEAHEDVADVFLSLTEQGEVYFSSIRCDSEPQILSPHEPTGAVSVRSTYSLIARRKG